MATTKDDGADSVQFFEGVEKLLEIWFTSRCSVNRKQGDLRHIPREEWQSLLKIVRCEIISMCHTDQVDAYVLSESSMFLSKRRLILKTCGTTTPLQCLEPLLELVKEYTGFDEVENVFYSRKNYKRPELQMSPHHAFDEEVALLNTFFPDGEAYCLGSADADCWYLYTLNRDTPLHEIQEPDQTLEILMTQLDPEVMSIFTRDVCSSAGEATEKSGIHKLIPNMIIDDFLFEPCGYSMNGLSKNGTYMTIHITPEPEFSYVSFETNIPDTSYEEIIRRVLNTFKPQKFVVTLFANKESVAASCPRDIEQTDYLKGTNEALPCPHTSINVPSPPSHYSHETEITAYGQLPVRHHTNHVRLLTESTEHTSETKDSNYKSPQCRSTHSKVLLCPNSSINLSTPELTYSRQTNLYNSSSADIHASSDCRIVQSESDLKTFSPRTFRSLSSPQLTAKLLTRSKLYRKVSTKSSTNVSNAVPQYPCMTSDRKGKVLTSGVRIINVSNYNIVSVDLERMSPSEGLGVDPNVQTQEDETKNKWNVQNIHITCNPLSPPYPYSAPLPTTVKETRVNPDEEKPRSRGCGNFLPILSLIPQTVISFQYLSPKMKFSWWRNKIS